MRFKLFLATSLAAISSTLAQHVFEPALVRKYTESMLSEFHMYTEYAGPAPTALQGGPKPESTLLAARQAPVSQISDGQIQAATSAFVSQISDGQIQAPTSTPDAPVTQESCDYWLEDIRHQGIAAFNPNASNYQVFRNVKNFGARGDGVTDDSDAINRAISSGGRCVPGSCLSTTITPAVVYFPAGVYMVNTSIVDYYYTQMVGNPKCLPTIKAFSTFAATNGTIGLIDGDPYGPDGLLYGSTTIFWRHIRNLIIDMTDIPASSAATGIHWPTAQATSIQNVIFEMNSDNGTQHQGIFIESGSGGFMNDLVFNGGLYGATFGNQQFTMRNMTFNNAVTAINQIWDWGWTYYGITINNCTIGLNMSAGEPDALSVGSMTFFDSTISNTDTFIKAGFTPSSLPLAANSIVLENIHLNNVRIAIENGNNATVLEGTPSNSYIAAWAMGHSYTPNGPNNFSGTIAPAPRSAGLIDVSGNYYQRSKPQYEQYTASAFISARDQGATGNGRTDDTSALQEAIYAALAQQKILFVDHGDYLVSSTIYIPPGSRMVGESYSVILSYGSFFNNINTPKPVVQIGKPGDLGVIEWSDMIVSTQGQQRGAILFEYNINSPTTTPTGVWDVHARIGGFAGSELLLAQCPTTPNTTVTASNLDNECIAAFLTVHITPSAAGIYLENDWVWVADHDVEDEELTQITVYAGRGLLDESTTGPVWLVGTSVEHHVKYEYQFANTRNVFAGQIQTETAYYQPNPPAPIPFPYVASYYDPQFPQRTVQDGNLTIPAADGWGLRIVDSQTIAIYGAGLYSFFNNYSTTCSDEGSGARCQNRIFSLEGANSYITVYNENTVGTHYMITIDGTDVAYYGDNLNGFIQTIALFKSE
ncbi:hypothetical protein LTR37_002556 [Vermiconidia calcicola]|uniref:Uncharacterized protein n=1 Tax=Vermiconidia calcicola TaxID=1690605 RepID=A0ACC3NSM4_9PEZI|nr:hypothetical protein LTR37_002556 [Vermiconidia calcicola]